MSKAFTSEETAEAQPIIAPRAPLPDGVPNYVTARGLALLHAELETLRTQREEPAEQAEPASLAQRRAELEERIHSAEVVHAPAEPTDVVRFGANVTVDGEGGVRRYRIVGVDEADPAQGRIAFVSPLARALLGRAVGDTVLFRAPRGDEELEIRSVEYAAETD